MSSTQQEHPEQAFSILCLSSQDWAGELPTNRQQIMRRAAERGHSVVFVETGSFLGSQLARLLLGKDGRSLARRLLATERVQPRVRVRRAINILPWRTKYTLPATVNARLTALLLSRLGRRLPQPIVLWIYDPTAAPLVGHCGEALAVYDCVDDYVEQAVGARRRSLIRSADASAARDADLVFATTQALRESKRRLNPRTYLVPNGADADRFRPAADRGHAATEIASLERPVLGFAGNITTSKLDFALLEGVAQARPEWTLLLVGPVRRDASENMAKLGDLPNVHWVGAQPHETLPRYVAAFDVALIPYRETAYMENCSPLKLYEYLAAGKPVVATGLPELRGLEPDVAVVSGADAFIDAVESMLGPPDATALRRRQELADANTIDGRAARLLELVSSALNGANAGDPGAAPPIGTLGCR